MIHTDETGRSFKICARDVCGQPFHQRPGEAPSKFQKRDYCSPRCRVASNSQPAPIRKQVTVERPSGFVNPDGVWRPPGFPVYPGGITPSGKVPDVDLPGMWEPADLSDGWADTEAAS